MKTRIGKKLFLISALVIFTVPKISYPEIIYLKDGQVLRGAITHEDKESITFKTKHQSRKIYRDHIKRILYGDRSMEKIHILLRNGKILKGYLVDQDANRVIFREKRDSAEEISIQKISIKQMSPDEIKLLSPDIFFHAGFYLPVTRGHTELSISPFYTLGSGMNFIWIERTRVTLEIGYTRARGKYNKDEYLQIIPVSLNARYSIPFAGIHIIPKIGAGYALLEFNDGESSKQRSYNPIANIGAGIEYPLLKKRINIGVWIESNMVFEESSVFKGVIVKAGFDFVF
jgi:sRNA-binding regulator protein Hfq